MKAIKLLKILEDYPIFTLNDIAKIVEKNPSYVKTLVYRLRKRDLIHKIERNKYSVHDDALIFTSHIYIPSYISLWSALRYYNLTEQLPRTVFVMVPKTRKSLTFRGTKIEFVKTKYFFGYKKVRYGNFDVFMAEPEKALIDSLISKKVPFNEIIKAISARQLDTGKLIAYALKINEKALAKRLGFLLEENNYECGKLRRLIDSNYISLDNAIKRKGKKDRKWRIVDNR